MAQFAYDDFEGTEGAELSAHNSAWTKHPSFSGNVEIASGRARVSSTTGAVYYHSGTPASADYVVSANAYKAAATGNILLGIAGRVSTSANTMYRATLNGSGSSTELRAQLFKFVGGTATQLGSTINVGHSTGDTLLLELIMNGTSISLDHAGINIISATDSSIAAPGKAGVRTYASNTPSDTNGIQLADFSADDIGGGAPTLSDLKAVNITATTVQGTYDYAF